MMSEQPAEGGERLLYFLFTFLDRGEGPRAGPSSASGLCAAINDQAPSGCITGGVQVHVWGETLQQHPSHSHTHTVTGRDVRYFFCQYYSSIFREIYVTVWGS
jgi:hypothetical protein